MLIYIICTNNRTIAPHGYSFIHTATLSFTRPTPPTGFIASGLQNRHYVYNNCIYHYYGSSSERLRADAEEQVRLAVCADPLSLQSAAAARAPGAVAALDYNTRLSFHCYVQL